MNIRQCDTVKDSKRGNGYRMVSRELLFYQDPKTGEILDQWTNPWTGETVDVLHVAQRSGFKFGGFFYERDEEGKPFEMNLVFMVTTGGTQPLFLFSIKIHWVGIFRITLVESTMPQKCLIPLVASLIDR
ncbi:MAG: hypothetical protein Ct9H300mP6_10920 [Gammaproteobacteria bacterium]|nr:MAG: hypothetical protein Ct9H300mP6_10920 [Gammaproteobacteria bacterium]